MTCDELFEVLTCDPAQRDAATETALQSHLAGCPRCRSLAETLAPALGLFCDAGHSDSAGGQAAIGGGTAPWLARRPAADGLAGQARRVAARLWSRAGRPEAALWTRLAAALLLGAALGGLWVHWLQAPGRATVAGPAVARSLGLVEACLAAAEPPWKAVVRAREETPGGEPALAGLQCCTLCHAASPAATAHSVAATDRVAQSCQLCHRP